VHAARIDPEHFHHLGLFGRGADHGAHPGALDPPEQRGGENEAHRDDDEPIGRIAEAGGDRQGEIQRSRDRDRMEIIADQQRAELLEQQDQREGEQHLVEVFAVVEIAKQKAFEQKSERDAEPDRHGQRKPERVERSHHQERRIGAHHEQAAMGQVDDPQHAEDEGEAARDQEQQQPVLQSVQELREENRHC
jgi:hypothetical protein